MRGYFAHILGRTFRSSFALFIGVLLVCFYGIWVLSSVLTKLFRDKLCLFR